MFGRSFSTRFQNYAGWSGLVEPENECTSTCFMIQLGGSGTEKRRGKIGQYTIKVQRGNANHISTCSCSSTVYIDTARSVGIITYQVRCVKLLLGLYDYLPSLTAFCSVWSVGSPVCDCAMIQQNVSCTHIYPHTPID